MPTVPGRLLRTPDSAAQFASSCERSRSPRCPTSGAAPISCRARIASGSAYRGITLSTPPTRATMLFGKNPLTPLLRFASINFKLGFYTSFKLQMLALVFICVAKRSGGEGQFSKTNLHEFHSNTIASFCIEIWKIHAIPSRCFCYISTTTCSCDYSSSVELSASQQRRKGGGSRSYQHKSVRKRCTLPNLRVVFSRP